MIGGWSGRGGVERGGALRTEREGRGEARRATRRAIELGAWIDRVGPGSKQQRCLESGEVRKHESGEQAATLLGLDSRAEAQAPRERLKGRAAGRYGRDAKPSFEADWWVRITPEFLRTTGPAGGAVELDRTSRARSPDRTSLHRGPEGERSLQCEGGPPANERHAGCDARKPGAKKLARNLLGEIAKRGPFFPNRRVWKTDCHTRPAWGKSIR